MQLQFDLEQMDVFHVDQLNDLNHSYKLRATNEIIGLLGQRNEKLVFAVGCRLLHDIPS